MASIPIHATSTTLLDGGIDKLSASKLFSVEGWAAVVTGGGTGLGLVTAACLAQNGARVYISGRRLEPLQDAAKNAQPTSGKGKIIAIQADAGTKEGIAKLRDEVAKHEKWINLLICNHGISIPHPKLTELAPDAETWSKAIFEGTDFEAWDTTYRINCASYHFVTFAFLGLLGAAQTAGSFIEPGNVLLVSSIAGKIMTSQRGQFNYNASKAGVIQLSKNLATEFMRRGIGIRVNCICPGYFPTGMSVRALHDYQGKAREEWLKANYGVPTGRVGDGTDYAQAILSTVTNKYVTGVDIIPDGGWMLVQPF